MSVKVTIELPEETFAAIKTMADDLEITQADVIKQSIESRFYLHQQLQNGRQVLLENPTNKTVQRLVFNSTAKA
jgi:predicted transcriptional regulator